MFAEFFNPKFKAHAPYYISFRGLSPTVVSFTLFQIRHCFRKKIKQGMCFLNFFKVSLKHFLL